MLLKNARVNPRYLFNRSIAIESFIKKVHVYKDEKISSIRRKKDVDIAKRNTGVGPTRYLNWPLFVSSA